MKQALIVGLGMFGTSLARALTERGVEVLCVDTNPELVQAVSSFAAEAVAFDASDEASLAQVHPERRDLCVCAMGNESRESSIIVTALLRQMGARRIVARAIDELTGRILAMVGAHQIVNPERAFGERLANHLMYSAIVEELPLGPDLLVTELRPPRSVVGRALGELKLLERHAVNVVAVRHQDGRVTVPSDPARPLAADDILVVVSRPDSVRALLEVL